LEISLLALHRHHPSHEIRRTSVFFSS
jgi:hypothetical protein